MTFNAAGLALLKSFEGLRLEAYRDMVGVWTIGFGDTHNVKAGDKITKEEAESRLSHRIEAFANGVDSLVDVELNDNQFSALVCFSYNVGLGALAKSTLLKKINARDFSGAAREFLRWCKAGGVEVPGLTRRRIAERDLFLSLP